MMPPTDHPNATAPRRIADERGNSVTLDPTTFATNLAATRELVGEGVEVFQVVKGDGYGLGIENVVEFGLAAGVDGFCVGTPVEARQMRQLAPEASTLLFTASEATALPELAAGGTIVTVHTVEAFEALASSGVPARFFLELECGFGRYGLDEYQLVQVLSAYAAQETAVCVGAYTHFGMAADSLLVDGLQRFDRHVATIRRTVPGPLTTMVASTDTILARPDLPFTAVDPGRLLYGLLSAERRGSGPWRPVLAKVASSLIQVTAVAAGERLKIGYEKEILFPAAGRTGVFPLGWLDGLSNRAPFGSVLVNGGEVRVLARTLLHSIVDLCDAPAATVGDEVVLLGEQGILSLELDLAAGLQEQTPLQMHVGLAGSIIRGARAVSEL